MPHSLATQLCLLHEQGVAMGGVALLALALAKWTWRTWVPSGGGAQ